MVLYDTCELGFYDYTANMYARCDLCVGVLHLHISHIYSSSSITHVWFVSVSTANSKITVATATIDMALQFENSLTLEYTH